ncbi:uncharacterized protein [Magallana gigas]|uniref:uncharacterized protein n=1 Tax=Magallana gigas TaxID=29159 RepID=UPI00333E2162
METFCAIVVLCLTSVAIADLNISKRTPLSVEWPSGTYTLVKPKSGCPPGWREGWTYQDNEDGNNKNSFSYDPHFAGSFGRNMKFFYCTKIANVGDRGGRWPAGNYCILQHGESCPAGGFESGHVHWDDEDALNKNSHGGILPRGSFGRNTDIYYCCRNDGRYNTEILLPTAHPFYLLRFTSPCQMVKGMYVREESVYFDDEDTRNKNYATGKHPMGTGYVRNQHLMYCYYTPLHTE